MSHTRIWGLRSAKTLAKKKIELSKKEMEDLNVFAGIIGHIGDGNFHGIILHDKNEPDERRRVEQCVHNMVARALDMDGTCTVSYSKQSLTSIS